MSSSLTELHAKLTADAPLENLSVSQCGTLRVLCVSAPRLERVNASMCKSLRRLELGASGWTRRCCSTAPS